LIALQVELAEGYVADLDHPLAHAGGSSYGMFPALGAFIARMRARGALSTA
jgi:hypothetical protein